MSKPVLGQTTFGSNTSGTTTQLDNNFLLAYNALNDLNTYNNLLIDVGTTNAYSATIAASLTGALTNGLEVQLLVASVNSGASTFAYNGGAALQITTLSGDALPAGAMQGIVHLQYRSSNTTWILQTPASSSPSGGFGFRNRLINPWFSIDQRNGGNTVVVLDDTYALDRWNILTQQANCNVSTQTVQENGTPQNIRLTQTNATASRLGMEQIVESLNCKDMRGTPATLTVRARFSVSQTIHYAIVEWTGTADSVTSDIVNDWNSSAYTTGNFFISANVAVSGTANTTVAANTWTTLTPLTANVSGNMSNLIAVVWSEANANQNVTIDIGRIQLEQGSSPTDWDRRPIGNELLLSRRYFNKTMAVEVAPADGYGQNNGAIGGGDSNSANGPQATWQFETEMRISPSVTRYNPRSGGAAGQFTGGAADLANARTLATSKRTVIIDNSGVAGAIGLVFIGAKADAEL